MPQLMLTACAGIVVGIMSGLLGIGGGSIIVPVLVYLFKINIHQAIGTSLLIIIPTAICGSLVHVQHGNVLVKVALGIMLFSIVGSFVGSHLVVLLPVPVLKKIFGIFLAIIAVKMIFFS